MAMNKRGMLTMKGSCSCSMPGVWSAVAHSAGAVVIFHSPKACGHVSSDMELGSHYYAMARQTFVAKQYTAPLITSNLQAEHSIFGGNEQLVACIAYVVERYHPTYIMLANSCVAGIIGDDIQAIAAQAEEQWNIPVLSVPCSGFLDGEYYAGFYHGGEMLIQRFMQKESTLPNTVTLLGAHGGPSGAGVEEIKTILTALGLKVHCHFPGYASLEEIRLVPASALCIPLGGGRSQSSFSMNKLAALIQLKFGVPVFEHEYPVGWLGMKNWIIALSEQLGRQEEGRIILNTLEIQLQEKIADYHADLQGIKVVLCLGRHLLHFNPAWVIELLALAGVTLTGIILFNGLTKQQQEAMKAELAKYTKVPVLGEEEGNKLIVAAEMIITTHELENESKRQFFLPVLPPLGVDGLLQLLQKLARLGRRSAGKGGVLYGW